MAFTQERLDELLHILKVETASSNPKTYPPEILALENLADRETVELEGAGVPFKVYVVTAREKRPGAPLFVNIHGGGWFIGHEVNDSCFAAWLATEIGGVVVDVDYSTSEFAPLTVMVEQCYQAMMYARKNAEKWGCDPQRISVGGYSAGGHLTAALGVRLAQEDDRKTALQILCYAPLDMRAKPQVPPANPMEERMAKRGRAFNQLSSRDDESIFHTPVMSPVLADDILCSKMPQTLVITAGRCNFRFEDEAFGARLAALGVETTICRFPSAFHGFIPHFGPEWMEAGKLMAKHIVTARA